MIESHESIEPRLNSASISGVRYVHHELKTQRTLELAAEYKRLLISLHTYISVLDKHNKVVNCAFPLFMEDCSLLNESFLLVLIYSNLPTLFLISGLTSNFPKLQLFKIRFQKELFIFIFFFEILSYFLESF